jgi:SAM-dependent methyltransferase
VAVFGAYSQYYDLLYRDKNYAEEVAYVSGLIERERPGSRTLLDLGCGTGRHDFLLAERGYRVTGVDMSSDMLEVARAERGRRLLATPGAEPPRFEQGDVRTLRLPAQATSSTTERFDVVVSLFHVMSYQSTNDDLLAALHTLREHCKPDGLVLFDAWYGPAVLSERPTVRLKRLKGEGVEVTRLAEPVLHANENFVDVNYQIFVKDLQGGSTEELHETHRMRYLFVPELKLMLAAAGLRLERACEFGSERELGCTTWNALFVARSA